MKNKISLFTLAAMSAASVLNATDYYYTLDGSYYGTTAPESGDYKTLTIESSDDDTDQYGTNNTTTTVTASKVGASSGDGGGAILAQSNSMLSITGNFVENSSSAASFGGGAVFTAAAVKSADISGVFLSNSTTGNGGAYYSNGSTTTLSGIFIANSSSKLGGAVYTTAASTLTITTSDTYGDTVFSGNEDKNGSNAIYNLGTINFSSSKGDDGDYYSVIVNDGISGSGTMTIESGVTEFNNVVSGQAITVSTGAILDLGSTTVTGTTVTGTDYTADYTANLSASALTVNGTLSLSLSDLGTIELCDVLFNSGSALVLDMSDIFGDFSLDINLADGSVLSSFTVYLDDETSQAISLTDGESVVLSSEYYSDLSVSLSGSTYTISGTAAVPEPSTYAMIFGVVALGFAAYRRRK